MLPDEKLSDSEPEVPVDTIWRDVFDEIRVVGGTDVPCNICGWLSALAWLVGWFSRPTK